MELKNLEMLKKLSYNEIKEIVKYLNKTLLILGVGSDNHRYLDNWTNNLLHLYLIAFSIMVERSQSQQDNL